jgi:hypothetical protein
VEKRKSNASYCGNGGYRPGTGRVTQRVSCGEPVDLQGKIRGPDSFPQALHRDLLLAFRRGLQGLAGRLRGIPPTLSSSHYGRGVLRGIVPFLVRRADYGCLVETAIGGTEGPFQPGGAQLKAGRRKNNSRRGRKEGRGGRISSLPTFGRGGAVRHPSSTLHPQPRPKGGKEEIRPPRPGRRASPEAPQRGGPYHLRPTTPYVSCCSSAWTVRSKSGSVARVCVTLSTEYMTVEWCLSLKSLPISG